MKASLLDCIGIVVLLGFPLFHGRSDFLVGCIDGHDGLALIFAMPCIFYLCSHYLIIIRL